jgi:4-amino-4-deoxy-L-arabinose transferase-like glycosyltransferase
MKMKRPKKIKDDIAKNAVSPPSDTTAIAISGEEWKRIFAIFISALVIRLIYLYESSTGPFSHTLISDSSTYHFLAKDVLAGRLGWKFFFQGVFYPSFLSLVYFLFGPSIIAVQIIQAFVGASTAVLTERLGTRLGGSAVGWVAGGIVALYAPLVFFDGELLAASWATFFAAALLYGFVIVKEQTKSVWMMLLGILGGMSVLNHPVFLPFFILCLISIAFSFRRAARPVLMRVLAACLIGFLLITLPVAGLNKHVTNHFSFLPSSGGLNLYLGNNPDTCDTLTIRPGERWNELVNEPVKHGFIYGADKETYYTNKFFDYVKEEPQGFLSGIAAKALRFINSREIPRNQDIYVSHQWSSLMTAGVWKIGRFGFPFSLLFAFAVMGLVSRGSLKFPMPVYVFLILYPLSVIIVFVAERYRLPMIPILAVLAGIGIADLSKAIQTRLYRPAVKLTVVLAAALLASVAPPAFCEEKVSLEAEMYFLGGTYHTQENNIDRAILFFRKAVKLNPDYFEAYQLLGLAESNKGHLGKAAAAFQRASQLNKDAFDPLFFAGKTLGQLGRYQEAINYLSQALKQQPNNGYIHSYLGICLANSKKLEAAYHHLKTAVQLMPNDPLSKQNLKNVEQRMSSQAPGGAPRVPVSNP